MKELSVPYNTHSRAPTAAPVQEKVTESTGQEQCESGVGGGPAGVR